MLKKLSDNIINLLKYFNYSSIDAESFNDFIETKVPCRIVSLVEDKETRHKTIDENLLNNLESAIDELNDLFVEEIDLDDINRRLKENAN